MKSTKEPGQAENGQVTGYPVAMADVERRNPKYIAILAIAAALVLMVGWLLRPRDTPSSPPPVPSETELEQLARRTERRALDDMTKYFAGVAGDVSPSLVYLPNDETTGIVWDASHLVTARRRDRFAQPTPIQIGSSETSRGTVASRATSLPKSGDWVIAVWRSAETSVFAAASFRQSTSAMCGTVPIQEVHSNLSLDRAMTGGGLFNMDGGLLGAILPCGDRMAVVETASVDELLERADTVEQRIVGRYGVLVGVLSDADRQYFKDARGLLVREVRIDASGDTAGLRPGDLVVALADQPVTAIDDLRPLVASSDETFDLQIVRGARTIKVTVGSDAVPTGSGKARSSGVGLMLEAPPDTYRIDVVIHDSRAARAGIRPGDRLARINGTDPRNLQQVRRGLDSNRGAAMLLEVVRDQRRIAVVLPQGAP